MLLPILFFFFLVFLVVDFALWGWSLNATAFLAAEGARWASVHGTASGNEASEEDVQNHVIDLGFLPRADLTAVTAWTPCGECDSRKEPGSTVTVTVTYGFNALPLPFVDVLSMDLTSSATATVMY